MSVVDQPVEDAIGGGGIADLFVPTCHRQLGSEDGRAGQKTDAEAIFNACNGAERRARLTLHSYGIDYNVGIRRSIHDPFHLIEGHDVIATIVKAGCAG
jgi:hypothetical protein